MPEPRIDGDDFDAAWDTTLAVNLPVGAHGPGRLRRSAPSPTRGAS